MDGGGACADSGEGRRGVTMLPAEIHPGNLVSRCLCSVTDLQVLESLAPQPWPPAR